MDLAKEEIGSLNKRQSVEQVIKDNPNIDLKSLSERTSCSYSYTSSIVCAFEKGVSVSEYVHHSRKENKPKRNQQRKNNYAKTRGKAFNYRKPWEQNEILLLKSFQGTDEELSVILGRSVQAIQVKRSKESC